MGIVMTCRASVVVITDNSNSNILSNILMMEPAQDRNRHNIADCLPASEKRRVLVQR